MGTMDIRVGKATVTLIDDDRICKGIVAKGTFEPRTLDKWAELCEPGVKVLDVGAYTGLFAIAAAKLGATPVAIEPMPFNIDRMRENAKINGVDLRIEEAAASDISGGVTITYNHLVHLTSGATVGPTERKGKSELRVRSIRLNSVVGLTELAAVKIDVEHHEAQVIQGALKLIERERPILIIEALSVEERRDVLSLLPRYRLVDVLDNRNLYLEPKL